MFLSYNISLSIEYERQLSHIAKQIEKRETLALLHIGSFATSIEQKL